jgi:hypothetical protein
MPAAEPADPGPDGGHGPGTVILFRKRPSMRRRRREDTMPNAGEPSASPQQRLTDSIEAYFLKHDARTLTDPETAEAYLITLGLVRNMLEGARVNGVVDDEQHGELQAMIDGMRAAPGLL